MPVIIEFSRCIGFIQVRSLSYQAKEYLLSKELNIFLKKNGNNRNFNIIDYNIEIGYLESPYINFDNWSSEIDVDLFFMIQQRYRDDDFYKQYTK